jgi:hypothetical protein
MSEEPWNLTYVREVGTVADASSGRADLMSSTTLDPRKAV